MEYKDIVAKCVEVNCGKEFTTFADDVKFYLGKGLKVPKRCQACRAKRKEENRKKERQQNSPFYPIKEMFEKGDF